MRVKPPRKWAFFARGRIAGGFFYPIPNWRIKMFDYAAEVKLTADIPPLSGFGR
jgi:hypothetical protein